MPSFITIFPVTCMIKEILVHREVKGQGHMITCEKYLDQETCT